MRSLNPQPRKFIPFAPPWIGKEEIREVVEILRSDWITTGPKTKRFEEDFAKFIGSPKAAALNSGTSALHTALVALGVGKGHGVITTPMTFCSGVSVIEWVEAEPILADIDPRTLNIDPEKIETILKKSKYNRRRKMKVILPVHFAGHPCEMDSISTLAKRYRLQMIEDAAHALPAKYKGRLIGSLGNLTAFSFYATKNMTTGEGGMLTGSSRLLEPARKLIFHGINRDAWKRYSKEGSWYYEVVAPGFKYNMMDLQAAIGIHQLRRLPGFHQRRGEIAARYNEAFYQCEELEIPAALPEVEPAWHLYVLRLNLDRIKISRNQFIEELKARSIGASVHFIPIHIHPYYRKKYGYKPEDFPVAYRQYQRAISLPLYPRMTNQDAGRVIEAVKDILKRFRR